MCGLRAIQKCHHGKLSDGISEINIRKYKRDFLYLLKSDLKSNTGNMCISNIES